MPQNRFIYSITNMIFLMQTLVAIYLLINYKYFFKTPMIICNYIYIYLNY